jgi:hypothetical protein
MLKTIDQLIEQSRRLEQENESLKKQLGAIRERLQAQVEVASPLPAQAGPPTPAVPVSAQEAAQTRPAVERGKDEEQDARSLLPEASDGAPGVFGEFNPGKGLWSASAGMKYRGFWLQGEAYHRKLDQFVATGPMPVKAVRDTGFYAQLAQMVAPNRIELYGARPRMSSATMVARKSLSPAVTTTRGIRETCA